MLRIHQTILCLLLAFSPASAETVEQQQILVIPEFGRDAYLLDDKGAEVKTWSSKEFNAGGARLLQDGSLLHLTKKPVVTNFSGAVAGGGVEILNAAGEVTWSFWNATSAHIACGDVLMLPNGNVLMSIVEWKSKEEAVKAGRDPAITDDKGLLVPGLMEVTPRGKTGGVPVWKWSLWNHLYQQKHPSLDGYSFPHPRDGCVDINLNQRKSRRWLLPFEIDYNAEERLILVTMRDLRQAWVIDHSTSTAEAEKDAGGTSGRGGRLLQTFGRTANVGKKSVGVLSAWWGPGGNIHMYQMDGTLAVSRRAAGEKPVFGEVEIISSKLLISKDGGKSKTVASNVRTVGDTGVLLATGLTGVIAKTDLSGEEVWRYQNQRGKVTYSNLPKVPGQTCCGGTVPQDPAPGSTDAAASKTVSEAPKVIKMDAAPVDRLRVYAAEVQAGE